MGACHPPPIVVSRTPPPIDSVWPSFLEQLSLSVLLGLGSREKPFLQAD